MGATLVARREYIAAGFSGKRAFGAASPPLRKRVAPGELFEGEDLDALHELSCLHECASNVVPWSTTRGWYLHIHVERS